MGFQKMIAFGPVPSRRLGSSLGINHIKPKNCTYACVYCQVGKTTFMDIERRFFYSINEVISDVETKLIECDARHTKVDYLTLVPDGEPTLDINLGKLIGELKIFHIPVAVISNSTLIDRIDVQEELLLADWVSLKIDTVDENSWKKINRPNRKLSLSDILSGIQTFRSRFTGRFVTETMLVGGLTDTPVSLEPTISFIREINPHVAYFSIPIRPPCLNWVKPPSKEFMENFLLNTIHTLPTADILFEAETGNFVSTGDLTNDILDITSVHPLREEALAGIIANAGNGWEVVDQMIKKKMIACVRYHSGNFYVRCFKKEEGKR
ncbi:MAG: radical SAM protein [Leptolinea sp.]|jgi:wyosine [tRNA(Phe)-imidazoG37] synthetase (radical SAM superfamily)|nr:radical SAM protein [Leptolinea sp.]